MKGGYQSLPYEDVIAKTTYFESLPLVYECVQPEEFATEIDLILKSISKNNVLLNKLIEVVPKLLELMDKKAGMDFLYSIGGTYCCLDSSAKASFLSSVETHLQKDVDYDQEIEQYIKPHLNQAQKSKFAIWRLCRLTNLMSDPEKLEELVFNEFSTPQKLIFSSEYLEVLKESFATKYIMNLMMNASDSIRIFGINAIKTHHIDTSDPIIIHCLMNEKSIRVMRAILNLYPDQITVDLLKKLIQDPAIGPLAMPIALKSPHLCEVIPDLVANGCSGCDLNEVDFEIVKKMDPVPIDFVGALLRVSEQFTKPEIITAISEMDESNVLYKLIYPRMNENGNWRVRFNAVQIFKAIISRKGEKDMVPDYAGFVIAMALDPAFYVRRAAFEALCLLPRGWISAFVVESILSLAGKSADDFQRAVVGQLLDEARPALEGGSFDAKIKEVLKVLGREESSFFK